MSGRSRAGCRFFQRLPHRLEADRIDQTEHDHLVGQQLQGPMAPAPGRVGAGQFDQLLFDVPPDLDLVRPGRLGAVIEGRLESLGDEPLPDAGDGPRAGAQGSDDLFIGAFPALRVVGQQEDAGMGQLAAAALPLETNCSNAARSSAVRVTRYFSIRSTPVFEGVSLLDASRDRIPNSPVNRSLKAH